MCVFRINSFIYDKEFGHQTCNTQTGRLENMNEENILILPQVIIIIIYSQFIWPNCQWWYFSFHFKYEKNGNLFFWEQIMDTHTQTHIEWLNGWMNQISFPEEMIDLSFGIFDVIGLNYSRIFPFLKYTQTHTHAYSQVILTKQWTNKQTFGLYDFFFVLISFSSLNLLNFVLTIFFFW